MLCACVVYIEYTVVRNVGMETFMEGKFPPGLLNPGGNMGAVDEVASWCVWVFGIECSNKREFILEMLFTTRGVWMLLPLSIVLLLLYRLVGPPEVRFIFVYA